ncbi:hypothetical protein TNCV_2261071 [Trichonephila clavipes]|nr:hypothetical protein TNCV_2261071 [Trichonephila clavipes]
MDGDELSCSNLNSDEDIRLSKSNCEESKKSSEEIDNIAVNLDIYVTRYETEWILYNNNVPGRFATRNVLRLSSCPISAKYNINVSFL